MLRYFTSGESHGEALVAFLSGLPAGLNVLYADNVSPAPGAIQIQGQFNAGFGRGPLKLSGSCHARVLVRNSTAVRTQLLP